MMIIMIATTVMIMKMIAILLAFACTYDIMTFKKKKKLNKKK